MLAVFGIFDLYYFKEIMSNIDFYIIFHIFANWREFEFFSIIEQK